MSGCDHRVALTLKIQSISSSSKKPKRCVSFSKISTGVILGLRLLNFLQPAPVYLGVCVYSGKQKPLF